MRGYLLALATCVAAAPALADGPQSLPCADFAKLDAAGQAAAMAEGETGGMMGSSGDAGGMMGSSGDAGGMMASSGDAGGMMAGDSVAMAAAACAAHPGMTVGAAMAAGH